MSRMKDNDAEMEIDDLEAELELRNGEIGSLGLYIQQLEKWQEAAEALLRLLLPDRKKGCLCVNCLREEIAARGVVVQREDTAFATQK